MRAASLPILFLGLLLSGCVSNGNVHKVRLPGLIYQHTRIPLALDMTATPATGNEGNPRHVHKIEIQGVRALSGDNSIGGIARASGLESIHYADLEIFRVLFYERKTLHVYGYPASD